MWQDFAELWRKYHAGEITHEEYMAATTYRPPDATLSVEARFLKILSDGQWHRRDVLMGTLYGTWNAKIRMRDLVRDVRRKGYVVDVVEAGSEAQYRLRGKVW